MFVGIYQTIVMTAALATFYVLDFVLIAHYDRQRQNRSWDLGYTLASLVAAGTLCLQPALLPGLGLRIATKCGVWVQSCGILLVLGSLLPQVWARLHLGRLYAEGADVQPEHYVVTTGPYAYVRHPLFVSYFLFAIGLLLVTPSLTMLLAVFYTFWDFSRAAVADERLMNQNVPGYAEYMVRTPRFIPRIKRQPQERDNQSS